MSIHTFRGGKFTPQSGGRLIYRPQSGGRLISRALEPPTPFLPNAQVGYGIGGLLKPLARTVRSQAKKVPRYFGKLVKRHGKKAVKSAAQQVAAGVLSGKYKKGKRKKAVKRLVAANVQKVKKDIQKNIQKDIQKAVGKVAKVAKVAKVPSSRKRKGFFLKYRTRPGKRRRKDIFDK